MVIKRRNFKDKFKPLTNLSLNRKMAGSKAGVLGARLDLGCDLRQSKVKLSKMAAVIHPAGEKRKL